MPELLPLKTALAMHGLSARKSFGQHFLLDSQLLDTIAGYAGALEGQHVVEVGPGPGGLTRALLARGARVTAIEKDPRFAPLLEPLADTYPEQFTLIFGDALKVDVTEISDAPRTIVANLPYNVGTLLLTNWLTQLAAQGAGTFEKMTLMFQKEVASRIVAEANTKAYGRLSVIAQFLCYVELHQHLPAGAFSPPPKVASSVISLTPKTSLPEGVVFSDLETLVATAFNQRRKMLRAALKPLGVDLNALFTRAGIDGTKRAENLSVDDFCKLVSGIQAQASGGGDATL